MAATVLLWVVAGRAFYISPDSVSYVGTASNLVAGHGFTPPPGAAPIGHFPPLFTLVLAAAGRLGPDPLTVARWLNPALLGASLVLVAVLVRRMTGSTVTAVAAGLAGGAGYDVVAYHSSALSEALFVFLVLAALGVLATHIEQPRPWLAASAGALAGAAVLTRYAGAALVLTGALALACWGWRRQGHGTTDLALFLGPAVAPTVTWLAWTHHAAGRATERRVLYHSPDRDYWAEGARAASQWFVPRWVSPGWRLGATGVIVAALVLAVMASRRRSRIGGEPRSKTGATADVDRSDGRVAARAFDPLNWLLVAFCASYLGVLAVDRMLLDITGRLEPRLLVPLHLVVLMLIASMVHRFVTAERRPPVRVLAIVAVAGLVALQVGQAASWSADVISRGEVARGGFANPAWRRAIAIAEVRRLPAATPVYSNAADAVYFITARSARVVPARRDYLTGRSRSAYDRELARMRDDFEHRGAVLVWFDSFTARTGFLPSRSELVATLGLDPGLADDVASTYRRMAQDRN